MGNATGVSFARGTSYLGGQKANVLPQDAIAGAWGIGPQMPAASLSYPANVSANAVANSGLSIVPSTGTAAAAYGGNKALGQNVAWITVAAFIFGAFLLYKYVKA